MPETKDKTCTTCVWYLGGIYDCCRLNLEAECRDGDFQAWAEKPKKGAK